MAFDPWEPSYLRLARLRRARAAAVVAAATEQARRNSEALQRRLAQTASGVATAAQGENEAGPAMGSDWQLER
jgi:hypothetical protein